MISTVSYTHLDVYKRQVVDNVQFLEPKDSVSANVSTNAYVPQNSYEPTYEPGTGTTPSYSNKFAS